MRAGCNTVRNTDSEYLNETSKFRSRRKRAKWETASRFKTQLRHKDYRLGKSLTSDINPHSMTRLNVSLRLTFAYKVISCNNICRYEQL